MTIVLPFHQDDRLPEDSIVLPPGRPVTLIAPDLPEADEWPRMLALHQALADAVQAAAGTAVTVVTGDCLATAGTLAGLQRAGLDPSLVWFDAHGDAHTLATSTSGYLGGISLRALIDGDRDRVGEPLGLRPVPPERCVLVGARDLDPAEVQYLAGTGLKRCGVGELGPDQLPEGPILLHIDLDVLDRSELSGLRFPASGGAGRDELADAVARVVAGGQVVALDLACSWEDPVGQEEIDARGAVLARLIGLLDGPGER